MLKKSKTNFIEYERDLGSLKEERELYKHHNRNEYNFYGPLNNSQSDY